MNLKDWINPRSAAIPCFRGEGGAEEALEDGSSAIS